jgi:hypothetical protein
MQNALGRLVSGRLDAMRAQLSPGGTPDLDLEPVVREAASWRAGVFAGVICRQLVTYASDLSRPHLFAAAFLAQAAVAAVFALVLLGVRVPMPTAAEVAGGRPLGAIVRQPRFIAAVICGVVSCTLMNFIVTAAPLAMRLCGLSQEASNLSLQWHIVGTYAPSFFTGRLIARFGAPRVVVVGRIIGQLRLGHGPLDLVPPTRARWCCTLLEDKDASTGL